MKWGKENLSHLSKNDIYFIGNGYNETFIKNEMDESTGEFKTIKSLRKLEKELTPKSASLDFALLASCNHTIASRGTFTIFASRFAGGHIITEFSPGYETFKESYKDTIKPLKQGRDISEL